MSEIKFPKVLIAAPQHDSKSYCWDKWIERVNNLTYPNYDVFMADNSATDDFAEEMKKSGVKVKRVGFHLEGVLEMPFYPLLQFLQVRS